MNILFSSAGRRNDLINYFRDVPEVQRVIATDCNPHAACFEAADVSRIAPTFDSIDFSKHLLKLCELESVDVALTLNDFELPLLARLKSKLLELGTVALVSDIEFIDTCWDKRMTCDFLSRNDLLVPRQYESQQITQDSIFPLIIKPRFGTSSVGVHKVNCLESFELLYRYAEYCVCHSSIGSLAPSTDLLIQELVEGDEYAVDIVNDVHGNFLTCIAKKKISTRNGDADCVVTVEDGAINEWAREFAEITKHVGNLDCDLIKRDGDIYCVDLNPRFGGAYPFSHLSGVNVPRILVASAAGKKIQDDWLRYDIGVTTSRLESYTKLNKIPKTEAYVG